MTALPTDAAPIFALVGRPGAGKGTQGRLLAERVGVPTLSTGDLLREAAETSTPLGRTIERYLSRGHLVPNRVVLELLWTRLEELSTYGCGVVLDGFPRNIRQALALDHVISPRRLDLIVELAVRQEVATERLLARRRSDDGLETIQRRMDAYDRTTVPMIEWFQQAGRLVRLEAHHPAEVVHRRLCEAVESLGASNVMSPRRQQ